MRASPSRQCWSAGLFFFLPASFILAAAAGVARPRMPAQQAKKASRPAPFLSPVWFSLYESCLQGLSDNSHYVESKLDI